MRDRSAYPSHILTILKSFEMKEIFTLTTKVCNMKILVLLILFSANIQASVIDLDALASYRRGNTVNTVIGSNTKLEVDHISSSALYLYSDNDVKIDRQYEIKSNADYPLRRSLGTFVFAVYGRDSKKKLDNYNKEVIGLSYKIFHAEYSVGVGRSQENKEQVFIKTYRIKAGYENEEYKLAAVAWYIQNPNDYDISFDASVKRKLTKILHVGVSIKYNYDSSPIGDSLRGDFFSTFIIGISL